MLQKSSKYTVWSVCPIHCHAIPKSHRACRATRNDDTRQSWLCQVSRHLCRTGMDRGLRGLSRMREDDIMCEWCEWSQLFTISRTLVEPLAASVCSNQEASRFWYGLICSSWTTRRLDLLRISSRSSSHGPRKQDRIEVHSVCVSVPPQHRTFNQIQGSSYVHRANGRVL